MKQLLAALALSLVAGAAGTAGTAGTAEILRIATFNTELSRKGPGLMLRDIQSGTDPAVEAVLQVVVQNAPDILVLQGLDWDHENRALHALTQRLQQLGLTYPYGYSAQPNSGLATTLDLNGDGRLGGPEDAQGYGWFTGQGGMAVLSRHVIGMDQIVDYSPTLWRDLSGAIPPTHPDGRPFPTAEALAQQRLPSVAIWAIPIHVPDSPPVTVLAFQAGPPVFDGPEDRNGRRNHDELRLLHQIVAGRFGPGHPGHLVLAGGVNLDPCRSDGRKQAIRELLSHPRLQDPRPRRAGASLKTAGSGTCAEAVSGTTTDTAFDTVDWPNIGRFRVDYILPSHEMKIIDAGVFWPAATAASDLDLVQRASRHRLVWVDLEIE